MSRFHEVTQTNGKPLWVNVDQINSICANMFDPRENMFFHMLYMADGSGIKIIGNVFDVMQIPILDKHSKET